jgi:hypothetical protein
VGSCEARAHLMWLGYMVTREEGVKTGWTHGVDISPEENFHQPLTT